MFSAARFPTAREVLTVSPFLFAEISTVTGFVCPRSSTRTNFHFFRSNSNGSNSHQPWLKTVRWKLKSGEVLIVSFILKGTELSRCAKLMSICAALDRIDCVVLICKPTAIDSDGTSRKPAGLQVERLQILGFCESRNALDHRLLIVAPLARLIDEDEVVHVLLKCSQHDA